MERGFIFFAWEGTLFVGTLHLLYWFVTFCVKDFEFAWLVDLKNNVKMPSARGMLYIFLCTYFFFWRILCHNFSEFIYGRIPQTWMLRKDRKLTELKNECVVHFSFEILATSLVFDTLLVMPNAIWSTPRTKPRTGHANLDAQEEQKIDGT